MKYATEDYCLIDPFDGERDVDVRCKTVKVVKLRKPRICYGSSSTHEIKAGDYTRCETGIFEGKWYRFDACIPCMDAWMETIGMEPIDLEE